MLLTHELDAVTHGEWRLLYILRDLNDSLGYTIFVVLHIAIFMAILFFTQHGSKRSRLWFKIGVSVFMIVHAIIHFRLIGAPGYTFEGILSNSLIFGSALFGAIYLAIVRLGADKNNG